jgi:putative ubiquitin-RnfH superfamily antitoxin RatB of RatAB toxin-antitoxin module
MPTIEVEVVYALPDNQELVFIECEKGSTIRQVLLLCGMGTVLAQLEQGNLEVGVFGFRQALNYVLSDHDRVEIYRPLSVSPTEARRLRALAKSQSGAGDA